METRYANWESSRREVGGLRCGREGSTPSLVDEVMKVNYEHHRSLVLAVARQSPKLKGIVRID